MPIFGSKQIEELQQLNEQLRSQLAAETRRADRVTDDGQKLNQLCDQLRVQLKAAQTEATTARQSLAEFEDRLRISIAKLGGLLAVDGTHWIDPESVWEMSIQDGALTINGRPVLKGSTEVLMAKAKQIADARTTSGR